MTTAKNPAVIRGYAINYNGLTISYTLQCERFTLQLDAKATAEAFKDAGLIEDWTADTNGEPVILFTDHKEPQGYGYDLWCHFIKSFILNMNLLHSVLEAIHEKVVNDVFYSKINKLLQAA